MRRHLFVLAIVGAVLTRGHLFISCKCEYDRVGIYLFFAVAGMSAWAFIYFLQLRV